ncbi:MAG: F0F1 ATP synthase subunit delta [Clostridioides sp.]|jgi:F-type H+-transporting ATPase subunit delta|nr:F0F1 ATP synthase subunit delta [Clostridioides sp.]
MIDIVARRYADALFQIGEEDNLTGKLYKEMNDIIDIIQSSNELNKALKSPLVSRQEKKNLLRAILRGQANNYVQNFLFVLVDKDRMSSLINISEAYKELLNKKNNVLEGKVITAIALDNKEIEELQLKLSSKYNKNIVLENIVDENILGGVLVRLGNEEIDGTVLNRLNSLKQQLSQVIS